jgi:hypothetical protein
MHLSGVPLAVITTWIGHMDASLTMKLYAPRLLTTVPTASNAIEPDANLRRVLDLPTVVRFFRAYGRPVVARVELDTE